MIKAYANWTLVALLIGAAGHAQPPSIPAQAIAAPDLGYFPVEQAAALELPPGMSFDQVASVAIDARDHLYVLHRGATAFIEFDPNGRFVRAFGDGLFERAHGLHIAANGHFWVTDVATHIVMELDTEGRVLQTLGTPGEAGEWNEAASSRRFDQPTDVAIGPDGNIFVTQGHSRGEPRVLKFDPSGRFLKSWGGRGTHPWQFTVAHSIVIDRNGLVYVADRENRRIVIFDREGEFVRGWLYRGMACSLFLSADGDLYMVTGFDGQVVKLDADGTVVGATGRPGEATGEFGEAHDIAVSSSGVIFVADVVNRRVQQFVPR